MRFSKPKSKSIEQQRKELEAQRDEIAKQSAEIANQIFQESEDEAEPVEQITNEPRPKTYAKAKL